MKYLKITICTVLIAIGLMTAVVSARAAINPMLDFSGKVTERDGSELADGAYDFRFRLFDAPAGGNLLWSEDLASANCFSGTVDSVGSSADGIVYVYSAGIATSTLRAGQYLSSGGTAGALIVDFDHTANTITVASSSPLFVAGAAINNRPFIEGGIINIALGAATSLVGVDFDQDIYLEVIFNGETMRPRKQYSAAAQAFNADKLDGYDASDFANLNADSIVSGAWTFAEVLSVSATSSATALTVQQNGGGDFLEIKNATGTLFSVLNDGRVKIGDYHLPANANGAAAGYVLKYGLDGNMYWDVDFAGTGGGIGLWATSSDSRLILQSDAGMDLVLGNNASTSLISAKLEVQGASWLDLVAISNGQELRFYDNDSSNYMAIRASSSYATNFVLTLPTDDGAAGQYLMTDGSGNLDWSNLTGFAYVNGGLAGQMPYYAEDGNQLSATSSIFISSNGFFGIGTTAPEAMLSVGTTVNNQFLVNEIGAVIEGQWNGDQIDDAYIASSTYWNMAYFGRVISATAPLTFIGNTIGLNGSYNIPLIASTTQWNTTYNTVSAGSANWNAAFSWGDHRLRNYFSTTSAHVLEAAFGGTGSTTLAVNGLLYGNGTNAVNTTGQGAVGYILQTDSSGRPVWVATSSLGIDFGSIGGVLPINQGGTGQTTLNDLIVLGDHTTGNYISSTTGSNTITITGTPGEGWTPVFSVTDDSITASKLAVGSDGTSGYVLTSDGDGTFSWSEAGASSGQIKQSFAGQLAFYASDGIVATGTTNLFWDNNNFRLGIGTTTPGATLSIGTTINNQFLVGSTGVITDGEWQGDIIDDDYIASSTWWNAAYQSRVISATAPITWSGNTIGLHGDYNIPLIASTTQWNTTYNTVSAGSANWNSAYSWGNHAGLYDVLGQATSTLAYHTGMYDHASYDAVSASSTWYNWAYNTVNANYSNWNAVAASSTFYNTNSNLVNSNYLNWNDAFAWGDHRLRNYFSTTSAHVLETAFGGTGSTTLAVNGLLYGNGTNAVNTTGQGAVGYILQTDSSGRPVWVATSSLGIDFESIGGIVPVNQGGTGVTTLDDLIILGQHTVGNYVSSTTGSETITITGTPGEAWVPVFSVTDDSIGENKFRMTNAEGDGLALVSNGNGTFRWEASGASSGYVKQGIAGQLAFYATDGITATGTTNLFWDNNNFRLGIGTTTPGASLSIGTTINNQFLVGSTGVITDGEWQGDIIDDDYIASSTWWNAAYQSRVISATAPITWIGNTIGLHGDYNIPLTASTTQWNTTYNTVSAGSANWNSAYSWGNHAGLYDAIGQATSTLAYHTGMYNHASYDAVSASSTWYNWAYNTVNANYSGWNAVAASSTFYNTNSNLVNSNYLNWNNAYSWANAGRASWDAVAASSTFYNTNSNIVAGNYANWNNAFSWGDHRLRNYFSTTSAHVLEIAYGGTGATSLNNLISLTTHTTGNYVASTTGSNTITISGTLGEGWTPVFSVTDDSITATKLAMSGSGQGNVGQVLISDGNGTFSWSDVGTTNGTVREGFAGQLAFYQNDGMTATGTTNLFWDNNNYRLGIGTTTPLAALSIGITSGNQFLVSAGGIITDGQWNGDQIDDDYVASSTYWNAAYQSRVISATAPITWSGNTIGLHGDYNISLTASTTQWNSAYNWGNHAGLYDAIGQATSTLAYHAGMYDHASYDDMAASSTFYNTNSNIVNSNYTDWNTAYNYGINSNGTPGEIWMSDGNGRGTWTSTSSLIWDNDFAQNGIMIRTSAGVYGASSTLSVAMGGTGFNSISNQSLVYASSDNTLDEFTIGNEGQVLVVSGGQLAWSDTSPASQHALLSVTHNDVEPTGTLVRGDLLIASSTNKWARMALGPAGYILYSNGLDAVWATTTSITALGEIIQGSWKAEPIGVAYGGTGATNATSARENLDLDELYEFGINATGTNGEVWQSDGDGRGKWVATSSLGLNGVAQKYSKFIGTTTITSDGHFATGTLDGYAAGNAICDYKYPGSFFCRTYDILSTVEQNDMAGWGTTNADAWIAQGPPGFTDNSNDCNGWNTNDIDYLGAFWVFNGETGGYGKLVNCTQVKPLACCKWE